MTCVKVSVSFLDDSAVCSKENRGSPLQFPFLSCSLRKPLKIHFVENKTKHRTEQNTYAANEKALAKVEISLLKMCRNVPAVSCECYHCR